MPSARICSLIKMRQPHLDSGLLFDSGPTVPTNGQGGWQTGCLFQHTDGNSATALYVNVGSESVSSWTALSAVNSALLAASPGVATASVAVILGTALQVNGLGVTTVGAKADTAISNVHLTSVLPRALAAFADDNGANIASDVKVIEGRMLLTLDQTGGSIRGVMGHLKLLTGIDVSTGIYTGVQGYVELVATHSARTGSTLSCVDASLEIGTALTVDSGGEACGIHVETTGTGTITNNGTCAAILIDKAAGAASWPVGVKIVSSDCIIGIDIGICTTAINVGKGVSMAVRIGEWAAAGAPGTAVPFVVATQNINSDGQLDIVGAFGESTAALGGIYSAKVGRFRHLVSGSSTSIDQETYGLVGQLVCKSVTLTGAGNSGLLGTFECNTTAVVTNGAYAYSIAAVTGRLGGLGLLTATTPVSAFAAILNGAKPASGMSIAYAACATSTLNFDSLLAADHCDNILYAATGTSYESGVKIGSITRVAVTASGLARVKVGGTSYYIALYAASEVDGE